MKLVKIILTITILIGGIIIGFTVRNFPFIKWNMEVKIYEVAQVSIALFIGLAIPFYIKKWIDDSRQLKNSLVDECKDTIAEAKKIKDKIDECHKIASVSQSDKDIIIALFSYSDIKINNLYDNILFGLDQKSNPIAQNIKDAYFEYWRVITGGTLMVSTYTKIDESLFSQQNKAYLELDKRIRQAIMKMQKI